MALLYKIVEDALLSGVVATGFGMVFNVPPRVLWMCAVGGALAHALRALLIGFGMPIEAATLVASTSLGLLGVYWTRRYLIPRLVFSIAALIPMISGSFVFKAMVSVLKMQDGYTPELMAVLVENGLKASFILLALSFGLALPSLLIVRAHPTVRDRPTVYNDKAYAYDWHRRQAPLASV